MPVFIVIYLLLGPHCAGVAVVPVDIIQRVLAPCFLSTSKYAPPGPRTRRRLPRAAAREACSGAVVRSTMGAPERFKALSSGCRGELRFRTGSPALQGLQSGIARSTEHRAPCSTDTRRGRGQNAEGGGEGEKARCARGTHTDTKMARLRIQRAKTRAEYCMPPAIRRRVQSQSMHSN